MDITTNFKYASIIKNYVQQISMSKINMDLQKRTKINIYIFSSILYSCHFNFLCIINFVHCYLLCLILKQPIILYSLFLLSVFLNSIYFLSYSALFALYSLFCKLNPDHHKLTKSQRHDINATYLIFFFLTLDSWIIKSLYTCSVSIIFIFFLSKNSLSQLDIVSPNLFVVLIQTFISRDKFKNQYEFLICKNIVIVNTWANRLFLQLLLLYVHASGVARSFLSVRPNLGQGLNALLDPGQWTSWYSR